jgi:hypothetical protein
MPKPITPGMNLLDQSLIQHIEQFGAVQLQSVIERVPERLSVVIIDGYVWFGMSFIAVGLRLRQMPYPSSNSGFWMSPPQTSTGLPGG